MLRKQTVAAAVVVGLASAVPFAGVSAETDRFFRVDEDILDRDLELTSGEEAGEIEDLVVDRDGRVRFALVERGGVLNIGEKHAGVPWESIQANEEGEWTVSVSEAQLKDIPRYDRGRSTDWTDSKVVSEIAAFFGAEAEEIPGPPLRMEDELLDRDLSLAGGEKLGEVEEVIIDQEGRVRYVVIEHEGALDLQQEVVVLPWEALQASPEGLMVNLDKGVLGSAPVFDDEDDIDWNDRAVVSEIATFWEGRTESPAKQGQ